MKPIIMQKTNPENARKNVYCTVDSKILDNTSKCSFHKGIKKTKAFLHLSPESSGNWRFIYPIKTFEK
jgi:hypothetical protein